MFFKKSASILFLFYNAFKKHVNKQKMGAQRPESLVVLNEQWQFLSHFPRNSKNLIKSIKFINYYIMFKLN